MPDVHQEGSDLWLVHVVAVVKLNFFWENVIGRPNNTSSLTRFNTSISIRGSWKQLLR